MQDNGAVIPVRIHTIVISVQHNEDVTLEDMRTALREQVIRVVVPAKYLDEDTIYHLQPSGRFVIGGPQVRPGLWMRPGFVIGVAYLLEPKGCRSSFVGLNHVCPWAKCEVSSLTTGPAVCPSVPEELGTCPQDSPPRAAWASPSRHLTPDIVLAQRQPHHCT